MSFAVTYDFSPNTVISSTQMNTNFADIETAINAITDYISSGTITNAMLAQITTASKVHGSSLTGLASVPAGAGILPSANGGTEDESGDVKLSTIAKAVSGWTEVSATYANKFIRISATALATGGSDTHTQTVAVSAAQTFAPAGATDAAAPGTYTTSAGDNVPAYITLRMWQKN